MIKIGLIGCGMWGKNLARNLTQLNVLAAVCDRCNNKAAQFAKQFNNKNLDFDAILADPSIDGVVIATSATSHDKLAIAALQAGKHVYVEKPLSLTLVGATSIANAAEKAGKRVMVGHLIRYHAVFCELQAQVSAGVIGRLRHIQANRLAMGRIRNNESVLFDLCPHDLSLILEICNSIPKIINSTAICYINKTIADIANTILHFKENITVSINASWINPRKEHKFVVIGTLGSIVFDDTNPWKEKVLLYRDIIQNENNEIKTFREKVEKIKLSEKEPLEEELLHFMKVCKSGATPLTNAKEGVKVQRVLDKIIKKTVIVN